MNDRQRFTLAHLSDPHLTSLIGVAPSQLANKRILGYLSWRRRRRYVHTRAVLDAVVADIRRHEPDHIAVTGDLTHIGLAQECSAALVWLNTLGDAATVSIVPGNHDRYVSAPFAQTVGLWQAYFAGDSGGIDFPYLRARGAVALIGVDTAIPTVPFSAGGAVGDAQREKFAAVLRRAGEAGLFRVVLLHHSPLQNGHNWRKRLEDASAVTETLCNAGAELVIHGHGHEERIDRLTSVVGPLPVIAVPSASHTGIGRAGWNQYRISGAVGAWRLEIETRRSAAEGFVTSAREVIEWGVSRATAPMFR